MTDPRAKPSTLPWAQVRVLKDPIVESRFSLRVHPKQVAKANEVALAHGCGAPFRKDGVFEDRRSNVTRYVNRVVNERCEDGEERLVNFDGGYRDPM